MNFVFILAKDHVLQNGGPSSVATPEHAQFKDRFMATGDTQYL